MNPALWHERRVLLTGHTGFKGAWLAHWLHRLGAELTGVALEPPTSPNLYELTNLASNIRDLRIDIRDHAALTTAVERAAPEIVFHLAAQSLVRSSYQDPVGTFATNVMGTVHLLDAVRRTPSVRAVVVVTSDKCYENRGLQRGYREDDALGGHDPYSASKACAEVATSAYRRSYFDAGEKPCAAIATARAGNVIGGGDWAKDRLLPDILRAFENSEQVTIRNPSATRPWQHVLDPLHGYLLLAEQLFEGRAAARGSWNFGPAASAVLPVASIVESAMRAWGEGASYRVAPTPHLHEAHLHEAHLHEAHLHEAHQLALDSSRATRDLGWRPALSADDAVAWAVRWHRQWRSGAAAAELVTNDVDRYQRIVQEVS